MRSVLLLLLVLAAGFVASQEPPSVPPPPHSDAIPSRESVPPPPPPTDNSDWLFRTANNPFLVPADVHVGFVGFNGDGYKQYHLDIEPVKRSLKNSMDSYTPACVESKKHMNVKYIMNHNVLHLEEKAIRAYEDVLNKNMVFAGQRGNEFLYDIEVTHIEEELDKIYQSVVIIHANAKKTTDGAFPNTVLFFNPDKLRLQPPANPQGIVPEKFSYRFRYLSGPPTQTWVAAERYVVIDLVSGPCEHGLTNAGQGTVSIDTIPSVESFSDGPPPPAPAKDGRGGVAHDPDDVTRELAQHMKFLSQISSLVVSAITNVFLPGARYRRVAYAEKVIVPIVVLRNHRRFNPISEGGHAPDLEHAGTISEFAIDIPQIRNQLKRMMLPHQELVVTTAIHNLHDHKHLSMSLFKALRGDSIHTATPEGRYTSQTLSYINSATLMDELRRSGDMITNLMNEGMTKGSTGHRILPVFVFSLLGLPKEMLLDKQRLHVASPRGVLVLQTGAEPIPIPFFNEDGVMGINPRQVTRHIVAGALEALAGVLPPYERFSVESKEIVSDYLFGMGHHPFGPFSSCPHVSQVFLDSMLRNNILTRVDHAYRTVHEASQHLEDFTSDYVYDSVGEKLRFHDHTKFTFADHHKADERPDEPHPLAVGVMDRLNDELTRLNQQFVFLADLMKASKLLDAEKLSSVIEKTSIAFAKYAYTELDVAREAMQCCYKRHAIVYPQSHYWSTIFYVVVGMVPTLGVLMFILRKVKGAFRSSSSHYGSSGMLPFTVKGKKY